MPVKAVFDSRKKRCAQKKELLSCNLNDCRKFVAQSACALSSILITVERIKNFCRKRPK